MPWRCRRRGLSAISRGPSDWSKPLVQICVGGGRVRSKSVCLLEVAVVARAEVVGGCYVIPASAFRE
jgi:hypothetical protein